MGVLSQLGHHLTSAMKHMGSDLCSVSQFHILHYFFFMSPHTQPFTPSSLIFLSCRCPLLFGPIIFSLRSAPPVFISPSSVIQRAIISHLHSVSFLLCLSQPLFCSLFSTFFMNSILLAALPPSFSTIYDCPQAELGLSET